MTEVRTRPTDAGIDAYLDQRAPGPAQRADALALIALLARVSGEPPRMWGPGIVGFGSYRYPLAGGRSGESCATGMAVRGKELVVYLMTEAPGQAERLARLGRHRTGRACLYLRQHAEVDLALLEALVAASLAELRRRHPDRPGR